MPGTLRRGLFLRAPAVSQLLPFAGGGHLGVADRRLILGFELVAKLLCLAELSGVTGVHGTPVFLLPALPALLRRVCGPLLGLADRAVVLFFPPPPAIAGLVGDPHRDLQERPLGLFRAHRPLVL